MQDMIRKAIIKSKGTLTGRDNAEIAENITRNAEQEKHRQTSAASRSLECWIIQSAATTVEKWLKQNNQLSIKQHSAFTAVCKATIAKVMGCSDIGEKEKIKSKGDRSCSASLADLVFWMTESIFEHVPYAVPTVPMALLSGTAKSPDMALPSFVDFLCEKVEKALWFVIALCFYCLIGSSSLLVSLVMLTVVF